MKKILICLMAVIGIALNVDAQQRKEIEKGVYLVSYGNTFVIEDDNLQQSKRYEVKVKKVDTEKSTGKDIYEVICGKWTRRAVKDGLQMVIKAGIAASFFTGSQSLYVSAAAKIADYIYDDVCKYYGSK